MALRRLSNPVTGSTSQGSLASVGVNASELQRHNCEHVSGGMDVPHLNRAGVLLTNAETRRPGFESLFVRRRRRLRLAQYDIRRVLAFDVT